ncbi:MAG: trypsin-like peptidase domain-containing protein [Spirochaetales bacterium]|nr:trypsin-like peptidase domain-containing protein [Spirochaetales bacterium]
MNFKKIIVFILITLNITLAAQSHNIKDKVVLVEAHLNSDITETFNHYSQFYSDLGNLNKAEKFNNISTSWFGSGFIIEYLNENYLITNRHVTDFAESFTVTINGGPSLTISSDNVAFAPDYTDIALIKLNNDEYDFTNQILPINEKLVEDGENIWAAGYPGINGTPIWQLSSGIITNSNVHIEEIKIPENSYIIQHSAPIDPGNSGGPLLIKDYKGDFSVVGINTWTVSGRNSTFFSIPTSLLIQIIEEKDSIDQEYYKQKRLETALGELLHSLADDINLNYSYLISENLVQEKGYNTYDEVRRKLLPSIAQQLENSFFYESAEETMREATYYFLHKKMNEAEPFPWNRDTIHVVKEDNNTVSIYQSAEKKDFKISLYYERGNWKVNSFSSIDSIISPSELITDKNKKQKYNISGNIFDFTLETGASGQTAYLLGYTRRIKLFTPLFLSMGGKVGGYKDFSLNYTDDDTGQEDELLADGLMMDGNLGLGFVRLKKAGLSTHAVTSFSGVAGLRGYMSMPIDNGEEAEENSLPYSYYYYGIEGMLEFKSMTSKFGYGAAAGIYEGKPTSSTSFVSGYTFDEYLSLKLSCFIKF